jgi:hypothetical protein
MAKSKKDLLAMAASLGVEADADMTNREIQDRIDAAKSGEATGNMQDAEAVLRDQEGTEIGPHDEVPGPAPAPEVPKELRPTTVTPPATPPGPATVTVYCPNRSYTGITAGVQFVAGQGTVPAHDTRLEWFERKGYRVVR